MEGTETTRKARPPGTVFVIGVARAKRMYSLRSEPTDASGKPVGQHRQQ
jgi:hypothetical protein